MKNSREVKLSIIVPVYNVERYIRPCVESIFNQGLDDNDFELILVNDGTRDNSFGIIADIIHVHHNIKILEQKNSGPSFARNNGMKNAIGQYLLFVDSDDLLIDNCIAKLLDIAMGKSADLLIGDYLRLTDEQIVERKYGISSGNEIAEKSGYELYLENLNPYECYVWRILYKRSFLLNHNIFFTSNGFYYEDIPFVHECYLKVGKCILTNQVIYIYRRGHVSITSSFNVRKAMDLNESIEKLWAFQNLPEITADIRQKIKDNTFVTLSFGLWCVSHNDALLPEWKTIVDDLKRRVPDLWFSHGLKQLFVSTVFRYIPGLYLKIRSIIKFRNEET